IINSAVFAKDSNNYIISIYNIQERSFILSNTTLTIDDDDKITTALDKVTDKKLSDSISGYEIKDGKIIEVIKEDVSFKTNEEYAFKIRVNGFLVDNLNMSIFEGDIIEITYATTSNQVAVSSQHQVVDQNKTLIWNEDLSKSFNSAFEWLSKNKESNDSYLMTCGISGKTADVKIVNSIINEYKQKPAFESPLEISKAILTLSFCGYDASTNQFGELVTQLSTYANIANTGLMGAVGSLLAYDCNEYNVSLSSINSRKNLVDNILNYQNDDGGFSNAVSTPSDVNSTAITITALSNYGTRIEVKLALQEALKFLKESCMDTGGFGSNDTENVESLCNVIVALNSLNIPLTDKDFNSKQTTLIERLMEFQNEDGGFCQSLGSNSDYTATKQVLIALSSIRKTGNPYKLAQRIVSASSEEILENV
ncbi:MAG: prenyltransferase/squalene oxidase repeat-containing protein, partial [Oscillospiraceae bacterium]